MAAAPLATAPFFSLSMCHIAFKHERCESDNGRAT
jgi:hypothetical protein